MSASHQFPCTKDCYCSRMQSGCEVTVIFARIYYKVYRERRTKSFSIVVPATMTMGERVTVMSKFARENLVPPAAVSFWMHWRPDWSHRPLNWWETINDWWYHKAFWGFQYTERHWVPINPISPGPPPPPLNRRTVRGSAVSGT